MSEYEFWDELGNIFNAIVAYQHKTIEFNKRFVNPWLRLGTVFDQNDRNSDALLAARKAIEIDQENGSNWFSLGDVYFKMGSFDDAASAYIKAIELNPKLGWAYANLALTKATQQKYTEAVNLYVKSLELIEGDKDRSMIWNRLGNVYRKVNDYENAFIAFQMADECDGQNTGFHDQLDEVTLEQKVMPIVAEVYVNNNGGHAIASQPVITEEPATTDETAIETVSGSVEQEARFTSVDDAISEAAAVSVEESPVAMEVESASENQIPEESGISEVLEAAELDTVAYQETDVVTPMVEDVQITNEQETEAGEPDVLLDEAVIEQQVKGPVIAEFAQVPEGVADDTDTEPVTEEVTFETVSKTSIGEDAVIEEAQPETVDEVPVGETETDRTQSESEEETLFEDVVVEDTQPGVTAEMPVEESAVEETQFESEEETLLEEIVAEDAQPDVTAEVPVEETQFESEEETLLEDGAEEPQSEDMDEIQPEPVAETSVEDAATVDIEASAEESSVPVFADLDTSIATPVMSIGVETFADPSALNQPVVLVVEDLAELIEKPVPSEGVAVETPSDEADSQFEVQVEADEEAAKLNVEADAQTESISVNDDVAEVVAEIVALAVENEEAAAVENAQPQTAMEEGDVSAPVVEVENVRPDVVVESAPIDDIEPAYEEFLKNAVEPVFAEGGQPVKNDLKAEPDSKNAHVWNELGNVYFNTGAYEEAISAYSKAIELDAWFAWPYSNLALVYVQKEKYAEAILLYQRSIELFSSDKDKAITWNRLGNVYRRLVDYDNAIACYQRADELDPNNATRSLRSRFSLLGSLNLEHSSSVAG